MATTSFIYNALGPAHYDHLKTDYKNSAIHNHVKRKPYERYCTGCHARWPDLRMYGRFKRTFFALPIGRRHQSVALHGPEQNCSACGNALRIADCGYSPPLIRLSGPGGAPEFKVQIPGCLGILNSLARSGHFYPEHLNWYNIKEAGHILAVP